MNVTFYSGFKKRINSTKQPDVSTTSVTLDVNLKNNTSVENPIFVLSGAVLNLVDYNYCKWGGRYYFVNDVIIITSALVELHCNIDVMATYKLDILGTDAFIERCETDYDRTLVDPKISTALKPFFKRESRAVWNQNNPSQNWGYVSCVAISDEDSRYTPGTAHYIFNGDADASASAGSLSALTNAFFSNSSLIEQLKGSLGNVQSSIIKMTYIPFMSYSDFDSSLETPVTLGTTVIPGLTAKKLPQGGTIGTFRPTTESKLIKFDVSSLVHYPVLKDFRNNSPYTTALLYLPFYGNVQIPLSDYLDDSTVTVVLDGVTYHAYDLIIRVSYDYVTGDIIYRRLKVNADQYTNDKFVTMDEYKCSCGVNIPVSQIIGSPEKFGNIMSSILTGTAGGAITGFTAGGPAGAAIGAVSGLAMGAGQSAFSAWMTSNERNLSAAGGGSSDSTVLWRDEMLYMQLLITGCETNVEPENIASTLGCPLMKQEPLGIHEGFVKCSNASVNISGHDQDKTLVNNYVNSGFFIE